MVEVVDLVEQLWEESCFKITESFDRAAVGEFFLNVLTEHLSGGDFFACVAKDSETGEVFGVALGQLTRYILCPEKSFAVDHIVYVRQDKRGTSAAYRLVKEFESWAKQKGATEVSFGVSTGIHPDKTHDFYVRMGYNHTGGIYKKPLKEN